MCRRVDRGWDEGRKKVVGCGLWTKDKRQKTEGREFRVAKLRVELGFEISIRTE